MKIARAKGSWVRRADGKPGFKEKCRSRSADRAAPYSVYNRSDWASWDLLLAGCKLFFQFCGWSPGLLPSPPNIIVRANLILKAAVWIRRWETLTLARMGPNST